MFYVFFFFFLILLLVFFFFFFFSSRRRHTRLTCDWSSDVCSSDLVVIGGAANQFRCLVGRVRVRVVVVGVTGRQGAIAPLRVGVLRGQIGRSRILHAKAVIRHGGPRGSLGCIVSAIRLDRRSVFDGGVVIDAVEVRVHEWRMVGTTTIDNRLPTGAAVAANGGYWRRRVAVLAIAIRTRLGHPDIIGNEIPVHAAGIV